MSTEADRPVEGEEHFAHDPVAVAIYRALARPLLALDDVEVRVSKSQVAFRTHRGFATAWDPARYVRTTVPLVVSVQLPYELHSTRFKEVAHPRPTSWVHHVELRAPSDVDDELLGWLFEAYDVAQALPRRGT